jgi:hypothetical protein
MVEAIRPETAFVYIFLREDGLRKLGWTINVKRRRAALSYATGIRHDVERVWEISERASAVEGRAHYDLRSKKIRGKSSIELYILSLRYLTGVVNRSVDALRENYPTLRAARLGMSKPGFIKAVKRARDRLPPAKQEENAA